MTKQTSYPSKKSPQTAAKILYVGKPNRVMDVGFNPISRYTAPAFCNTVVRRVQFVNNSTIAAFGYLAVNRTGEGTLSLLYEYSIPPGSELSLDSWLTLNSGDILCIGDGYTSASESDGSLDVIVSGFEDRSLVYKSLYLDSVTTSTTLFTVGSRKVATVNDIILHNVGPEDCKVDVLINDGSTDFILLDGISLGFSETYVKDLNISLSAGYSMKVNFQGTSARAYVSGTEEAA